MKVRLVWIESNFRGEELNRREEVLDGESEKSPTGNHIARLIARRHPELRSVNRVYLMKSHRPDLRWRVRETKLAPNRWVTVYADPVKEPPVSQEPPHP
jgi:hypothetical protein